MEQSSHLEINLGKIEENACRIAELCSKQESRSRVTKASALPRIVRSMIRGGIENWRTPGLITLFPCENSTLPKA